MPNADDRYLLKLKVLYCCYKEKKTQTEAASLLGISRVTVNKLIKEAWDEGMISIEIIDSRHMDELIRLENRLRSAFSLDAVTVVDCPSDERAVITHSIAKAAAASLDVRLKSGMKIAFSWGETLEAAVSFIKTNPAVKNVKLYTLLGTAGVYTPQTQPNLIIQNMLRKIGGEGYIINAPFICQTQEICEAIKQESHIKNVLQESSNSDIILLGIGESPDVSAKRIGAFHYSPEIISEMHQLGAVGDICGNFFDINGNILSTSISDRIVAADIRMFRGRSDVICLGGGEYRISSILGALNGRYFSELYTDKFTAKKLLERVSWPEI